MLLCDLLESSWAAIVAMLAWAILVVITTFLILASSVSKMLPLSSKRLRRLVFNPCRSANQKSTGSSPVRGIRAKTDKIRRIRVNSQSIDKIWKNHHGAFLICVVRSMWGDTSFQHPSWVVCTAIRNQRVSWGNSYSLKSSIYAFSDAGTMPRGKVFYTLLFREAMTRATKIATVLQCDTIVVYDDYQSRMIAGVETAWLANASEDT